MVNTMIGNRGFASVKLFGRDVKTVADSRSEISHLFLAVIVSHRPSFVQSLFL